ncbi:hypothetical protein E8P82_09200 [Arthrobacter echini]|uniref:Uncharacterized protein n=1 Tax=Arthrobacter echini TaxID=1529066 RepID=A0A4S5E400_9MICC|nr:hypothetical protein [Arthrobacter echini]THJ66174.1 hypothetical protein E8P82_09200 [Arthrobacter echini]
MARRAAQPAGVRAVPDRGGLLPLWTVRCTAALVAVLLGAVVWGGSAWLALPLVVAVVAAVLPSTGLVCLSLLLLVVPYAVSTPSGWPWLPVFVAGLHLLFVLYLLLLPLPRHGWISLLALRELALSYLRIQAVAQPVAVLALLLDDDGSNLAVVIAGVAAVSGWSLWLVGRTPR